MTDENEQLQTQVADLLNNIVGLNGTINTLRADAEAIARERDGYRAENQALRAEIEQQTRKIHRLAAECVERLTENERLNAERQGWADTFAQNMKVIGAENEELRTRVEQWHAEADRQIEVTGPLRDEIRTLRGDVDALVNNAERAVNILMPLFDKAHKADSPDEEAIAGALDVLTGWFGQNGKPLRKLDVLEGELAHARALIEHFQTAVHWNEERRDIQAKEIERLREALKADPTPAHHYAALRVLLRDLLDQMDRDLGGSPEREGNLSDLRRAAREVVG